jgi:hypothetical protein
VAMGVQMGKFHIKTPYLRDMSFYKRLRQKERVSIDKAYDVCYSINHKPKKIVWFFLENWQS